MLETSATRKFVQPLKMVSESETCQIGRGGGMGRGMGRFSSYVTEFYYIHLRYIHLGSLRSNEPKLLAMLGQVSNPC